MRFVVEGIGGKSRFIRRGGKRMNMSRAQDMTTVVKGMVNMV